MATKCPICGAEALEPRHGEFRLDPPASIPGGVIIVPDADWLECSACGEQILGSGLNEAIELVTYDRLGLLRPKEIEAIRLRMGLTQVQMAELLGVGEKTYTRWEAGKSYHNTSSDNLIRLAAQSPELFARLSAQRDPERRNRIAEYVRSSESIKGGNPMAMAAHGDELEAGVGEVLRKRLREIIDARKQG
jgi:putative zinc finger/helix-turn-helix YgiT family protein